MSTVPESSETPAAPKKQRRIWRTAFFVLLAVFIGIQFIPVNQTNPAVDPEAGLIAPEEVKVILRKACYDCHSNETRWPWYSKIAPGSWLMAHDVEEGREYLNFSTWGEDYGDEEFCAEMFRDTVWEYIENGEMPLWFYIPLHPEARLTEDELMTLKVWSGVEPDPEAVSEVETEGDGINLVSPEESADVGDEPEAAQDTDEKSETSTEVETETETESE